MSSSKIIGGLALFAGGYAIAYYGANVLMWAHGPDESASDPIPLSHLFGFPSEAIGDPGEFMPPFKLGGDIPGAITDARGLLGGTATTGGYIAPEFTVAREPGYGELGASSDEGKTGGGTGLPPLDSPAGAAGVWVPPDIQVGNLGSAIGNSLGGYVGSGTPVPKGWKPGVGFVDGNGNR